MEYTMNSSYDDQSSEDIKDNVLSYCANKVEYLDVEVVPSNENELLYLICNTFGFDDRVYNRVIENGFDIESLMVATESEINDLFPVPLLGTRAKFKYKLNLWRNGLNTHSVPMPCREWIEMNSPGKSESITPDIHTPVVDTAEQTDFKLNNLKLVDLLKKSVLGSNVLKFYAKEQYLDEVHRDILTSVIVDSYYHNDKEMSINEIVKATNAIGVLFPTENKNYYIFKRGQGMNPIGKLHDKAVNARVKMRKLKKRQSTVLSEDDAVFPRLLTALSAIDTESILWLAQNTEPWSEVEKRWSQVIHARQADIRGAPTSTNVQNILQKWSHFKHRYGHTLVDIDYNIIYKDNKSDLFRLWPIFSRKILSYYQVHIKDKGSLNLFRKLNSNNVDNNSRDCIIIWLLHAILKPTVISFGTQEGKKLKWKPTIIDSQESSILHATSVNEFHTKIETLKNKYHEKGLTFQPVIMVVGKEQHELQYFYTYYDGILYRHESFLKCLDITFKLFHVLNFQYPKESKNVYNFIGKCFYNFNTESGSNVTNVLDYIQK